MNALTKSLGRSGSFTATVRADAVRMKQAGELSGQLIVDSLGGLGNLQNTSKDRRRYEMNRGWLYSAVNALSMEAAGQPVCMARVVDSEEDGERSTPPKSKAYVTHGMPGRIKASMEGRELEMIQAHPLLSALEHPNKFQNRWQFVYSFVSNLNLTGKGYIVMDNVDGEIRLYSLPTSWVTPVGKEDEGGLYAKYRIRNPKTLQSEGQIIEGENVVCASLPDPADPMKSLAPSTSQANAIKIDEHIQDSQSRFFENGIFPGVIITVGKNPHPDVPSGVRPRLSGAQRREVHSAIKKVLGGVANYGNPAVVDGLIEKIERLSMTSNEMGWEKSEEKSKQRILSAFAVNPFVLGEKAPSSYAQAKVVYQLFHGRVNTFLELLGCVINTFVSRVEDSGKLVVWWEKAEWIDPKLRADAMKEGRKNGDVSRNEYRADLGLTPVDEEVSQRSPLLDSVGGMTGAAGLLTQAAQGNISMGTLAYLLSIFFKMPKEEILAGLGDTLPTQQESVRLLASAVHRMSDPVVVQIDGGLKELIEG